MEEEGDGIKQRQECVILVMIEMISAGTVDNVADAIIMINDQKLPLTFISRFW